MRKKLKLSSDGGDSGSKKCKRGLQWGPAESGFRRSVLCWCDWQEDVKMFSHLIYIIKKSYKRRTFNATCKDNAALNSITIQEKTG
jgi:hypothetical protein